jgi:phosphotransferase system IIA component
VGVDDAEVVGVAAVVGGGFAVVVDGGEVLAPWEAELVVD